MAVTIVDLEVETVAPAFLDVALLAEREILDIGLGPDREASELALVGQPAGRRQGEPVPVGFIGQVQALADEAAL